MAKDDNPVAAPADQTPTATPPQTATPVAAPAAPVDDYPLTLAEFCQRLSAGDRRVEMIGAFHYTEKAAGREKDTHSAYAARFVAFCNAPA